jgi:hypothetical protein
MATPSPTSVRDKIAALSLPQRVMLAAKLLEIEKFELAHALLDDATAQTYSLMVGARTRETEAAS